jgi:hypothetical protein
VDAPTPWEDPKPRGISEEKLKIIAAYHQTFGCASGGIVLDDMKRAYSNRSSFCPDDPYGTAFREGQRDVYLKIIKLLAEFAPTGNSASA